MTGHTMGSVWIDGLIPGPADGVGDPRIVRGSLRRKAALLPSAHSAL